MTEAAKAGIMQEYSIYVDAISVDSKKIREDTHCFSLKRYSA